MLQKIDQLNEKFSTVQADLLRWKMKEEDFDAEHMEDVTPDMGNTAVTVPIIETRPVSTINFIPGEMNEIQPDIPTVSQYIPVTMTPPPSLINLATSAGIGLPNFYPMTSESRSSHPNSNTLFSNMPRSSEVTGSVSTGNLVNPVMTGPRILHDSTGRHI